MPKSIYQFLIEKNNESVRRTLVLGGKKIIRVFGAGRRPAVLGRSGAHLGDCVTSTRGVCVY